MNVVAFFSKIHKCIIDFSSDIKPHMHKWGCISVKSKPCISVWSTAGDWTTCESGRPISESSLSSWRRRGHRSRLLLSLLDCWTINIKKQGKQHLQDPPPPPCPGWFNIPSRLCRLRYQADQQRVHSDVVKLKNESGRGGAQGSSLLLTIFIKGQSHSSSCRTGRWILRLITDQTRRWNTNRLSRLPWLLRHFFIRPWAEAIKVRRRRRHRQAKRFVGWRRL